MSFAKLSMTLLVVVAALLATATAMDPTRAVGGKQHALQSNSPTSTKAQPNQKDKGGSGGGGGGRGGGGGSGGGVADDVAENSGAADLGALEVPADLSHLPAGAAAAQAKSKALLEMLGPAMPLHAVASDISFIGFGLERDDTGAELARGARPAVLVGVSEASKRDKVLTAARKAVNDEHILVQSFVVTFEEFPPLERAGAAGNSLVEAEAEAEAEVDVDVGAGAWTNRQRPVRGGASISRCARNSAGTLGGFLTKAGSPAVRYGLTNMHVLGAPPSPFAAAVPVGQRAICQPAGFDGGAAPGDAFGEFKAGAYNSHVAGGNLDFAVFKVDGDQLRQTRCSLRADHLGGPYAIVGVANVAVGNVIEKFGRTTEHTRSNVAMTGVVVVAGSPRANIIAANLQNTLGAPLAGANAGVVVPGDPFGWSGDSGSFYLTRAPGGAPDRFNVVGLNKGRVNVGGGVWYVYGFEIGHVLATINAGGLNNGALAAGHLPLTVCTSNQHLL